MKRSLMLTLALVVTASLGFAAGGPEAVEPTDGGPSGTLVLYTSQQPAVAQETVDAFMEKHPNIEVEWTRNGTSQLMNILRAEIMAGQVQPDVLLVADTINLGQLKAEGLLMAYPDAPVQPYNPAFYDEDKTYFGTKLLTTGIAYNPSIAPPVATWAELLKQENAGQIAVPSPLYSGAALNHLHSVLPVSTIGWDFYEGLDDIGVTPQGGNGPALNAVASGLARYGIIVDADTINAKKNGSPVDFIYPEDGVSFITEPVAIMSSARNVSAAQAFVDFVLSREGQELTASQGIPPLHPDVVPPDGFRPASEITLLPLNVEQALSTDTAVKERFSSLFGI
jgi:iron(III) transport system substrate-binding protein